MIEEEVLAKAEAILRAKGTDIQSELAHHLSVIVEPSWRYDEHLSAAQNFVAYAEFLNVRADGSIPSREERNLR